MALARRIFCASVPLCLCASPLTAQSFPRGLTPPPPAARNAGVPQFLADAYWPRPLPNNWILGQVSGVAVGPNDHVYIVHRPATITTREAGAAQDPPLSRCCVPAPPVVEFDQQGNVVRAWGQRESGAPYWPTSEHGITVDASGSIWIASNGRNDQVVMKFSPEGRYLLTIGRQGQNGGSNDSLRLGQPTSVEVDLPANEVYIADGYQNRRVVVFDATTGAYKRHWGAYGRRPVDGDTAAPAVAGTATRWPVSYDTTQAPQQFTTVHAVRIGNDGLVYVADRINNRIQVFRKDGTFVREAFIARATRAMGSVWDLVLSRDREQTWIYVVDGTNQTVWIVRRSDLSVAGSFGNGGRMAGDFGWVHNGALDSHGNFYTGEVDIYKRVQRFVPR